MQSTFYDLICLKGQAGSESVTHHSFYCKIRTSSVLFWNRFEANLDDCLLCNVLLAINDRKFEPINLKFPN